MAIERLPSLAPEVLVRMGRKFQEFNYRYEAYATKKEIDGITVRSYDLIAPTSETLLSHLISRASPRDVVYDVGANVGHYSLPLAMNGCFVYAFEPDPTAFENLEKNIDANKNIEIELFDFGLSREESSLTFYISTRSTRSSFSRFNANSGDAEVSKTKDVNVKTVDSLVFDEGFRPPDHVKVDVEGHGLEVLEGAERTLEEYGPIIYFEPHVVNHGGTRDKREDELRAFFDDLSYEVDEFEHPCWICTPYGRFE